MLALQLENLSKTYANGQKALHNINLNVSPGEFFGLLGPNGAGKTTLIGILCSMVVKSSGRVTIFDADIDENFSLAKSYIGLVPQEFNFSIFETPFNILVTQAGYYGVPRHVAKIRAEQQLKRLGIWDKRATASRMLSGGMKRRLMIARALMHEPKLLILDEPTAGVDIELRRQMWSYLQEINQQGVTIILTTHYLEEAESLCRNIAIINHGEIIAMDSTRDLLAKLQSETFIFDLAEPLQQLPFLGEFTVRLLDATTLEVSINNQQQINQLFSLLSGHNITVKSLRNKANRLEELFVNLVNSDT